MLRAYEANRSADTRGNRAGHHPCRNALRVMGARQATRRGEPKFGKEKRCCCVWLRPYGPERRWPEDAMQPENAAEHRHRERDLPNLELG